MNKALYLCVMTLGALVMGLPLGCGSSKSSPSSPSSSPNFNYGLDYFFGSSGSVTMDFPVAMRISGGTIWVANSSGNNLQAWTTGGIISDVVTTTFSGSFGGPSGIGIGADGYVYVSDVGNEQVAVFTPEGHPYLNFGHTQLAGDYPEGVAVNSTYAYVVDYPGAQVIRFTISGTGASKSYGSPVTFGTISTSGTLGTLSTPTNVNLDSQGNVYVADHGKQAIMKYNYAGVFQAAVTASGLIYPHDVAVDGSGNLYVADYLNSEVRILNSAGAPVTTLGDATAFSNLVSLSLDSSGNCYGLDEGRGQIVVFNKQ
jgi:NHL repeat